MPRTVVIEVDNQYLRFSAAHFTLFSATERERLHGHNFAVRARVYAPVNADGMAFNYNELKRHLHRLCQDLDEYTLVPEKSPYLQIAPEGDYYAIQFGEQKMLLLQTDTLLLPVSNITLEELGYFMIQRLKDSGLLEKLGINHLELEVASGPGQRVTSLYQVATAKGG